MALKTVFQSSELVELMVAAFSPARVAASTWLSMSASSGEMTSVGPCPAARSAEVADQYTADFPQPVACTTSTRALGAMTAATASSWSARGIAPSPASRCSTVCRWSCASAVVVFAICEGLAEPL